MGIQLKKWHLLIALAMTVSCLSCGKRNKEKPVAIDSPQAQEETTHNIGAPQSTSPASTTYKLYIENSASMYGYFDETKDARDLRLSMFNLVSKLGCDKLSFINSIEIPAQGNAADILRNMRLEDFKRQGRQGDPTESNISQIIRQLVEATGDGECSLLVSDFIFCPSRQNALTSLGPDAEKSTITDIFSQSDKAVAIFKLEGHFAGTFYTGHYERGKGNRVSETSYRIEQRRPYYLWAIGGDSEIGQLIRRKDLAEVRFVNATSFCKRELEASYSLLTNRNYTVDRHDNRHATRVSPQGRGQGVSIEIRVNNLRDIPVADSYLLDTDNYETNSSNWRVSNIRENGDMHVITVSGDRVVAGELTIRLKKKLPQWVDDSDLNPGWDIRNAGDEYKTYGFKALVSGVMDAMTATSDNYTTLNVRIN